MTTNIESQEAIPARDALANPGELPMATPGITQPLPADGTPVVDGIGLRALKLPPASIDRKGVAWDATRHESPPRQKRDGTWACLRGNAALKAAGRPMSGIPTCAGKVISPAQRAEPATIDANPVPPPVADSFLAPEAPSDSAIDAELIPARSLDSYRATAETLTRGTFAAARLGFGPAWEPDRQEREEWTGAWQRCAHAYQWPYLPPWIELLILAVFSIAKRAGDPTTKERWTALVEVFKRRPPPPPQPPVHDTSARPSPGTPRSYSPYDAWQV